MTEEEARKNLEMWLDLAASNPVYNKYDELCHQAYEVLDGAEYQAIYNQWASQYVMCSDGLARRR